MLAGLCTWLPICFLWCSLVICFGYLITFDCVWCGSVGGVVWVSLLVGWWLCCCVVWFIALRVFPLLGVVVFAFDLVGFLFVGDGLFVTIAYSGFL